MTFTDQKKNMKDKSAFHISKKVPSQFRQPVIHITCSCENYVTGSTLTYVLTKKNGTSEWLSS